jgi:hypothetical protein
LGRLAGVFIAARGWERVGFARLQDYAVEPLGLSGRSLHEWARVENTMRTLPATEAAFSCGELSWNKARLICRVAAPENEEAWLQLACRLTSRALSNEIRAVDRNLFEASDNDTDEDGLPDEPRECVSIRCRPRV